MANHFVDKLKGFADLSQADVAALAAATAMPRRYRAKHDLIREGDQPGPVFVMLEGWACRRPDVSQHPDGRLRRRPAGRQEWNLALRRHSPSPSFRLRQVERSPLWAVAARSFVRSV